jgi:hypothetical protein
MAADPNQGDETRGRAWKTGTKLVTASLSCAPDHFFVMPELSFWEKLGTSFRQAKAFLRHSHEHLIGEPMAAISDALMMMGRFWPNSSTVALHTFRRRAEDFLKAPTENLGKWLLQVSGKVL